MSRSLSFFALCSGGTDGCPWKQAQGLPLDAEGGRRCPLCDHTSLRLAMASRNGQEITSALVIIEAASSELYTAALRRLEDMEGAAVAVDFRSRVERTKRRRSQSALRRPAAAGPAPAPPAPEAHDD